MNDKPDETTPAEGRSPALFAGDWFGSPGQRDIAAAMNKSDRARIARMDSDPNNGRAGWWKVSGLRHCALARASSAGEAVQKASELVGDWEGPEASFWCAELPEVFTL